MCHTKTICMKIKILIKVLKYPKYFLFEYVSLESDFDNASPVYLFYLMHSQLCIRFNYRHNLKFRL